ncbi:MAG: 50S ribosomal protein L10 [Elusimicrobia bacterium]|nr:50S ribosomal protein L10 [Elusimicrobiota bacterium]
MPNATKNDQVSKLTEELKSSAHVVVTNYQGMTALEFDSLRAAIRPYGGKYKVVKNRLAKLSFKNTGFTDLQDKMKGPSAIVYQGTDASSIIKALFKFGEQNEKFKVKAGRVFGITADTKSLKAMADLPSREVLLATLLARMNGPLTNFVTVLNEPLRSLQAALVSLAKKKEEKPA